MSFLDDEFEVLLTDKAFGVDLVNVLGSGGSGGEPAVLSGDFEAADGGVIGGSLGHDCGDGFSGEGIGLDLFWREGAHDLLLGAVGGRVDAGVNGVAKLRGELLVVDAGVLAGDGEDLGGEEGHDDAVLIGGPYRAVLAEEGGSGAFLTAEAVGAVDESINEPFKADGDFGEGALEAVGDAVDHRAADEGFADGGILAPQGSMREEVIDGYGEVVVGVEESGGAGDDAVAVVIGVVAEGDVEFILKADEACHGVWGRAVHADLAVLVDTHEAESLVGMVVDDSEFELVFFGDARPEGEAGAAEGVGADIDAGLADGLHVEDVFEVVDIGGDVVMFDDAGGIEGILVVDGVNAAEVVAEVIVGEFGDEGGDIGVGGAAVGGVVFDAAVVGGVVGWGDDDAVGGDAGVVAVEGEDGV